MNRGQDSRHLYFSSPEVALFAAQRAFATCQLLLRGGAHGLPCARNGVWDSNMILHAGLNRQDYAQHLEGLIQSQKLGGGDGGTPEQWANDSLRLAGTAWVPDGTNLDEQYYQREIRVVDRQMALAGLRLAKLLNDSIGKMTPRDFR